jgi:hypothetical protein
VAVAVGTIVDGPVKDGSSDSVRTVLSPGGIIKESGGSSVLLKISISDITLENGRAIVLIGGKASETSRCGLPCDGG